MGEAYGTYVGEKHMGVLVGKPEEKKTILKTYT
jgi:hypothetical protein